MEDMRTLTRRKGSIKSSLTNFKKYVEALEARNVSLNDNQHFELEQRLIKCVGLLEEFSKVQLAVGILNDINNIEDDDQHSAEALEFENSYYKNIGNAKTLLDKSRKSVSLAASSETSSPVPTNAGTRVSVKLPVIPLPKFDNTYKGWLEFRDSFESLIHTNETIHDVQKFHYLRAAISGEAAQVIKALELSAANYLIAWDLLCNRYNNKDLLVHNHLSALFNLESIKRESPSKIRELIDSVTRHLRALQTLGEVTEGWSTLVIYLIVTRLDPVTARDWEQYKLKEGRGNFKNLQEFLVSKADLLEKIESSKESPHNSNYSSKNQRPSTSNVKAFASTNNTCVKCNQENHTISNCSDFLALTPRDRFHETRRLKICANCFRLGHYSINCRATGCLKCKAKHNTLLHFSAPSSNLVVEGNPTVVSTAESITSLDSRVVLSSKYINPKQVLLATALIYVLDNKNRLQSARALLDPGSQCSLITSNLCTRLGIAVESVDIQITGLNNTTSSTTLKCNLAFESQNSAYSGKISCFVLPEVVGKLPNHSFDATELNIPFNLKLADPSFNKRSDIDILLGADCCWKLMSIGQISLGDNKPMLCKTVLGWIISGTMNTGQESSYRCNLIKESELDIQNKLQHFWEIEEIVPKTNFSLEEQFCEDHFIKTTVRTPEGRFVVNIPLKDTIDKLGNSFDLAENRLNSLRRKFSKNTDLKVIYTKFMDEYRQLGHMSKIKPLDKDAIAFFLPHHAVLNTSSLTTKLRVVFDGSARSSSGFSINHLQLNGPVIQDDLLSIVLRFRKHAYVASADIAKMYRQVLIDPAQRNLQCILWYNNQSGELEQYTLNTVTYGTVSASFLAIRCLHELANECHLQFPDIARIIKSDFYVDDLITGANTVVELVNNCNRISTLLTSGCFDLRKWTSNNKSVLEGINNNSMASEHHFGSIENSKALGLVWSSQSDVLCYDIKEALEYKVITKRVILSCTAQIFDPLGLLSPCIILAKMLLQQLWKEKLGWDESVSMEIHTKWSYFRNHIIKLNKLAIPRHVICVDPKIIDLHCFSDASQTAYGACAYIRSENNAGEIFSNLLCAKTKVAPVNQLTIPRLELCGALVLSKLLEKIVSSMNITFNSVTFWTDSTVILGWLKMSPSQLKPFVGNRVSEIQNICKIGSWRYVPTKDNPADLLSRGIQPSYLENDELWWHGPSWLMHDRDSWPTNIAARVDVPEVRENKFSLIGTANVPIIIIENYSNYSKLQRIIGYVIRFISNCRIDKQDRQIDVLTVSELNSSTKLLVKIAQQDSFSKELQSLRANENVHCKSNVLSLNPFLDHENIIRVGGRLSQSNFGFNKKHPMLLSHQHHLTKIIFKREHARLLHAGPQLLLANTRQFIWSTSGKSLARHTVRDCLKCFRVRPQFITQKMGNLPSSRITPSPPFDSTGVDYAGPFSYKLSKRKGVQAGKCYIALFVCLTTKAIHLELVTDLTSEAFIATLRRFVARRGKPTFMYSDNGTNFVGAQKELRSLHAFLVEGLDDITSILASDNIKWSFIPPRSPNFGGLWEAGVKSTKYHLKRVLGSNAYTFEDFYTLLTQVEAILNSRPLSSLSSDPNDLLPLTPGHFLIGRPLDAVPDPDLSHISISRLSRYQHIQRMSQSFWARWSKDYLHSLQQRTKWNTIVDITIGSLVIIKCDNLPPMQWLLGKVLEVHPGKDDVVRVVTLKTIKGNIRRSISNLCPLPMGD